MLHLSAGTTGTVGGEHAAITMTNKYDNPDNSWKLAPVRSGVSNTGFEIRDMTDSRTDMSFDGGGNVGIGTASPTSRLHISNGGAPADDLTLLTLENGNGTGDVSTPDTWIDFVFKDTNTNVTPQARIGAHAGDGGDANTQILEGKGYLTFHTSGTTATSGDLDPPERMRIDSAGAVTMPSQPRFHAYGASSGYTPTSYSHSVKFSTVANTSGHYSTTTGLFTAPVTGTYLFQASVYSTTTANWSQAWLTINGARGNFTDVISGAATIVSTTHLVDLTIGDTVGYHPYTGSGTYAMNASNHHTYFKGRLLG